MPKPLVFQATTTTMGEGGQKLVKYGDIATFHLFRSGQRARARTLNPKHLGFIEACANYQDVGDMKE